MNQEEKRIKLALADGIVHINSKCWRGHKGGYEVNIPDYFNDLNAVHELENVVLRDELVNRYEQQLQRQIARSDKDSFWSPVRLPCTLFACATAAQRAEAIGLTLNLWTP